MANQSVSASIAQAPHLCAHRLVSRRMLVHSMAVILFGLASGCGLFSEPPVAVSYRESLLGHGQVLIITNASRDKELIHVGIRTTLRDGRKREVILRPRLAPGETVEAGWLELHQRSDSSAEESAILPGAKIEIFAYGYANSVRMMVPKTSN